MKEFTLIYAMYQHLPVYTYCTAHCTSLEARRRVCNMDSGNLHWTSWSKLCRYCLLELTTKADSVGVAGGGVRKRACERWSQDQNKCW